MAKKERDIPTGLFGRSTRLLSAGATMVGKEMAHRLQSTFGRLASEDNIALKLAQARELVDALSHLRGAAMKAGQLLSIEASDLLPKEVVDILRELHDEADPMPFATIEKVLLKEWGAERFHQVEKLSREPIAAASIGQVHRATIAGRDVAIKIQIPGVDKTIDSDLKLLRRIAGGFLKIFGKNVDLDEVFAELSRSLKAEVDYRKEAQAAQSYRKAFEGDERYLIPEVLEDWSTKRVLTLDFVEGTKLTQWLSQNEDEQQLAWFTSAVLDLLIKEFFLAGLVQTDPNYGNFLIKPAEQQLVLLDFGATRKYSKAFRRQYLDLIHEVLGGDDERILEKSYQLELIDERESSQVKNLYIDMIYLILSMFREENQPFEFANAAYIAEARKAVITYIKSVKFTAPPKNMIFLNRKLGGMFHLLKEANARIDLAKFLSFITKISL